MLIIWWSRGCTHHQSHSQAHQFPPQPMAKAILIRCETLSNPYWIGLLRVEPNGSRLAWHSLGWPVVLPGTISNLPQQSKLSLFCWLYTLSLHKSFCKWRNIFICQTDWVSVSWILSQWSWNFDIIPCFNFIFCVPIICATNIFVSVIRM